MYQTIQVSSCVSVAGRSRRAALPNGDVVIRDGGHDLSRARRSRRSPSATASTPVRSPPKTEAERAEARRAPQSQPASSRSRIATIMSMCAGIGVQAGDVGEALAARVQEASRISSLISSSVSTQSAEKAGAITAICRLPRLRQPRHLLDGIGLQPLLGAEARLEADHHLVLGRSPAARAAAASSSGTGSDRGRPRAGSAPACRGSWSPARPAAGRGRHRRASTDCASASM